MRRRNDPDRDWAFRDTRLMMAFVALLVLAGFDPRFLWGVLAALLAAAFLGVRYLVGKRRRERLGADAPFWVDRLGSSRDD